ncbi:MAG TPA: DUF4832 domain-containing protein [Planctomycetota bacterium]|nr:DUF4832 domain-containing protein [Planctomycetota bacterium]
MAEVIRRVRPTPSDAYLANPHKGNCTFQHFNGDDLFDGHWSEVGPTTFPERRHPGVTPHYLPSTVAYCRWFWQVLEPSPGAYDFSMIEGALRTADARGQTLAIRLMAYGHTPDLFVPDWYQATHGISDGQPDHDSPAYLRHWGDLVREAGRRFDGDPRLESIDIAYIGPWGEGAGRCSREQCRRFAALWKEAFPNTPRLALIEGAQMEEGLATGSGWRCDCYGDLSANGSECVLKNDSWNHTMEAYPREIFESGATDTWKTAPVHFETCWTPSWWHQRGWDLPFILQQGLKFHGTYFMPKSLAIPESYIAPLSDFCKRLGYRFVLRNALIQSPVALSDGGVRLQLWIENIGVAPIYRRYDLAVRLRQRDRQEVVLVPDVDVRAWLPGDAWVDRTIRLPPGFKPGWIDLAVGLVTPGTAKPRVKFAVKEQFADGWVSLNGIEVD